MRPGLGFLAAPLPSELNPPNQLNRPYTTTTKVIERLLAITMMILFERQMAQLLLDHETTKII